MNIVERLISTVASHECIVCGLEGKLLCESCLNAELPSSVSRCYRCHSLSPNQAVCSLCRKSVRINHVWVSTDYDAIPKELIKRFKFERAIAVAELIAKKIDQVLPDLPRSTYVCHIPTANSRVRRRGYDQAHEIAKQLVVLRGFNKQTFLQRVGSSRQVGSKRIDRFKQLEGAFKAKNINQLKNAHILLVDDVTTTGATIESAAKILKDAGAKTIDVAVFAQPI